MDPHCLRYTELPGASKLFLDFLYHFERVERFYSVPNQQAYPEARRASVVAALRRQNPNNPSVDQLAKPGTVAVVTGQQVGLFSGPAYTIYKALTAVKVARRLAESGTPAVPVFWLATEDHDFAEIQKTWVFGPDRQPIDLRAGAAGPVGGPVGPITVDRFPADALRAALAGFASGEEVAALVEAAYQPGASMGGAFRVLAESLLKPYGLIFLDPLDPAIRDVAIPFLAQALATSSDLTARLKARSAELAEAGYHSQVLVDDKSSLFFSLEGGRRTPLRKREIDNLADLSPNALLRPVMQDFLLPTHHYVGGPAELAYLAQSQVLYQDLLGRMPRPLHRSGFTLLDARAAKLMDRYRLGVPSFFDGEAALREKIAGRLVPHGIGEAFAGATRSVAGEIDSLIAKVRELDPSLENALGKSRSKILYQLGKMERKTAREQLRRDGQARQDAAYLGGLVYPHKHLQERLYSFLPFLADQGLDLIGRIYDRVSPACPDHQVLPL